MRERNGSALLCLVIDAADNAETAAAEAHDGSSFARLLLRESLPDNARLVLTVRTHRVASLNPPPDARRIDLLPFSLAETAVNLRAAFPEASARDIDEFHRLTSSNPRVQAAALTGGSDIQSVLAGLGPKPLTVQDSIARLLETAVANVRDQAPKVEQEQLDRVCAALATLRPFVPLTIVARTADVPVSLVTSLANDLGRPLLVRDGAVQFRDEPTETWFRDHFRPSPAKLGDFIARLMPLAASSAYVAAALPQLMHEAGQFDDLVRLSLEGGALPVDDAVARRDVELQRLRFALQAAVRDKKYEAAAKLSLKAGGEMAAGVRQQELISRNTDLGAYFLDAERMQEQVSRRQISGGDWTGSEHVYEAAFLSGLEALAGDARSRLRIAYNWLAHWSASSKEDRRREESVEIADIAELAWAELNLHGARRSADQLRRWTPRDIAFRAGRILVARLVDAGRFEDVSALALAAGNDIGLLLAIALELAVVDRSPPAVATRRATALVASRRLRLQEPDDWRDRGSLVAAVTALVIAAARARVAPPRRLASILGRYLPAAPPRSLITQHPTIGRERASLMRAYALRAALLSRPLSLNNLAPPKLRKALAGKHRHDGDAERFREDIGALLPWATLWAAVTLGRVRSGALDQRLTDTVTELAKAESVSYRERSNTADEIAGFWSEIILIGGADEQRWTAFDGWRAKLRQPLFTATLLSLARRAARCSGWRSVALTVAREAFDLAAREREDAEQKTETLILLARAVLPVSLPEARAYFAEAVTASGKIGSENLSRWQAMLHLGEAAAQDHADEPELAYRFARGAELTYDFVARDKHFDWEHTVETLADLSPPSAFAILSRWLDRRFGREERLLPVLVGRLLQHKRLDARTASALLPIRGWWEADRLLDPALSVETDPQSRAIAARHVLRYSRFSAHAGRLRRVEEVAHHAGIALPDLADAIRCAEATEASRPCRAETAWRPSIEETARDWEGVFSELTITSAADLLVAAGRFRAGEPPFEQGEFYSQAMGRVRAGDEAAFLDALRESRSLDLFDIRALLKVLPTAWKQRLSARPALQRLLRDVVRQNASRMSADRHYEVLAWNDTEAVAGMGRRELMEEALAAIAATTVPDNAGGLFRLTGLLSYQLDAGQAKTALRYGLDLFELSLETKDSDGPWSPQLQPPATVEEALAGYVWAALGAPAAERRWEAAHVVRALCVLRREAVLKALVGYADNGTGGVFADAKLRFYYRHALLWLVIALARAADESGPTVAAHAHFLRRYARREQPHVLLRGFAAHAIISLHRQRLIDLTTDEAEDLESINTSHLPTLPADRQSVERSGFGRPYDETRFSFGIDIGPYWLAPLGRCFALDQSRIEDEAEKVIREDWGLADNGRWDRDERATRRYYEDSSWRHSHGATPKVDDLQFYLSFHALMTVAGKLLESQPTYSDDNGFWSSFSQWLRRHDMTRRDGLWLADRRDPTPLDLFVAKRESDSDWTGSVNPNEAFRLLTPAPDAIIVSGYWTHYAGERRQVVSVNSALASRDRAEALVRALRTVADPYNFKVPDFEDSLGIDEPPYVFKGWLADGTDERALDEYDPWAAAINPRVLAPARPFAQLLALTSDVGQRQWRDADGSALLTSQVWSDGPEGDDDQRNGSGRRLIATPGCVDALMRSTGLDLVVEISVTRTIIRSRYAAEKENEVAGKVTEIVLLRPGQPPWRVPIGAGTRRGAGRRTRPRSVH